MTTNVTAIKALTGRLIMGSAHEPQTKDNNGRPLVVKNGPNAGQPCKKYYMGVAIPKNEPGWPALRATLDAEAKLAFPHLFDANGNCTNPNFAFKILDGDSQTPNEKGNKPCDKEGAPGHWIINFSNGFAPKYYEWKDGAPQVLMDPTTIKRGDYVQVHGTIKGNGDATKPGMYLNHSMVLFVGHGEEIFSGPDATEVFAQEPTLPAGASSMPQGPSTNVATNTGPTPPGAQVGPKPGSVEPHPEILTPKMYTVEGAQYTEEQLKGFGWTDAQIAALNQ